MPFLDSLTPEEVAELRSLGRERRYGAGVTVFHQDDEAGPVAVLLDGRAKVVSSSADGREVILAVRGPGELIGELAALDDAPRQATVVTLEPVEALVLGRSAFLGLLERRPAMTVAVLRTVAERLRYAHAQQAAYATQDVAGRVAGRVVELADRYGRAEGGRVEIELPLSQEELASWTGASREAVARALQQLRGLRMVETGRRHITVLDAAALRRLAGL
jgi:CRP/FNR family cyclic AMP-dependent transcriptional regulator